MSQKNEKNLKKWEEPTLKKFNKMDFVKSGINAKSGVENVVYKSS